MVRIVPLEKFPEYLLGVDASYFKGKVAAVACLYQYPNMTLIEETSAVAEALFPYIPGYLSFREGPVIMEAIKKLDKKPDLILFDGQGIAHPKGVGIASHIGVLLNIPAIGCAKSRLVGSYKEPGSKKGSRASLRYHGRIVGAVLRTKDDIRPLFVSPGHKVDLKASIAIVLGCTRGYRIPEPLRRADSASRAILKTNS